MYEGGQLESCIRWWFGVSTVVHECSVEDFESRLPRPRLSHSGDEGGDEPAIRIKDVTLSQ